MGDRWRGTERRVAVHNVDRGLLAQSGHNADLLSWGWGGGWCGWKSCCSQYG